MDETRLHRGNNSSVRAQLSAEPDGILFCRQSSASADVDGAVPRCHTAPEVGRDDMDIEEERFFSDDDSNPSFSRLFSANVPDVALPGPEAKDEAQAEHLGAGEHRGHVQERQAARRRYGLAAWARLRKPLPSVTSDAVGEMAAGSGGPKSRGGPNRTSRKSIHGLDRGRVSQAAGDSHPDGDVRGEEVVVRGAMVRDAVGAKQSNVGSESSAAMRQKRVSKFNLLLQKKTMRVKSADDLRNGLAAAASEVAASERAASERAAEGAAVERAASEGAAVLSQPLQAQDHATLGHEPRVVQDTRFKRKNIWRRKVAERLTESGQNEPLCEQDGMGDETPASTEAARDYKEASNSVAPEAKSSLAAQKASKRGSVFASTRMQSASTRNTAASNGVTTELASAACVATTPASSASAAATSASAASASASVAAATVTASVSRPPAVSAASSSVTSTPQNSAMAPPTCSDQVVQRVEAKRPPTGSHVAPAIAAAVTTTRRAPRAAQVVRRHQSPRAASSGSLPVVVEARRDEKGAILIASSVFLTLFFLFLGRFVAVLLLLTVGVAFSRAYGADWGSSHVGHGGGQNLRQEASRDGVDEADEEELIRLEKAKERMRLWKERQQKQVAQILQHSHTRDPVTLSVLAGLLSRNGDEGTTGNGASNIMYRRTS